MSEAFTSGIFAVVADVVTLARRGARSCCGWTGGWPWSPTPIVPVLFAGRRLFPRIRARDAYREVRRRLARLNAFLQESLQGMAVIQLFGREEHERRQFERLNAGLSARRSSRSTTFEASLYAAVEALGSAGAGASCSGTAAARSWPAR